MKIKTDFVTNSSSTSYTIDVNVDMLEADIFLIRLFEDKGFQYEMNSYDYNEHPQGKRLDLMKKELNESYDFPLYKGDNGASFGDEDGTIIGRILDYCIRDGFSCEEFSISYEGSNR